jgi:hypothetical protein
MNKKFLFIVLILLTIILINFIDNDEFVFVMFFGELFLLFFNLIMWKNRPINSIKNYINENNYKSKPLNPNESFFSDEIGMVTFENEGLRIYGDEDVDSIDDYLFNKKKVIKKKAKITEEDFEEYYESFDEDEDFQSNYLSIPYSDITFKAIGFNIIGKIPHDYIIFTFDYHGKTISGSIKLSKYILYYIKKYKLTVENLKSIINNQKKFYDNEKTVFVFNSNSILSISDLGISMACQNWIDEFIILYEEIEKIIITNQIMLIKTKYKSFYFPYKEQILKTLQSNFKGEIIIDNNYKPIRESLVERKPIICKKAIKYITNENKTAYAEIFKKPNFQNYFFVVSYFDISNNYWDVSDIEDQEGYFVSVDDAIHSAESFLNQLVIK